MIAFAADFVDLLSSYVSMKRSSQGRASPRSTEGSLFPALVNLLSRNPAALPFVFAALPLTTLWLMPVPLHGLCDQKYGATRGSPAPLLPSLMNVSSPQAPFSTTHQ